MLVFGGNTGALQNDVWALSLAGTPEWTQLIPSGTLPIARAWHTAIYDSARDRMLVFGGSDYWSSYRNDVWVLEWSSGTGVEPPTGTLSVTSALHPGYPNPFNPEVTIPFELRQEEKVTLVIYDAMGRFIKSVFEGMLPRGSHTATWDGRNGSGEQVSSGIYFCRMQTSDFSATCKLVFLK